MNRYNLIPREESIVDLETLNVSHRWQAFFSDIKGRVGEPITAAGSGFTAEQFGAVLNDILREMRAQKLIQPDTSSEDDALRDVVKAFNIIPGSGEFVYGTTEVFSNSGGDGIFNSVNGYNNEVISFFPDPPSKSERDARQTDHSHSIDNLVAEAPQIQHLSLIVSWFGTDLRCGDCKIKPKIDNRSKVTWPFSWRCSGETRNTADLVTLVEGSAAFGGTTSDKSVIEAIIDANDRGLGLTFYPFILMDVPSGNGLPDPYGGAEQDTFPWRGRITCYPGPDQGGTVDKTSAAGDQVAAFLGSAQADDFSVVGESVTYTGPEDWGYRRFILHYAHLCAAAGGVDTFLIGSELRGLTWVRDSASTYPFVSGLVQLAADVKGILGGSTNVTYAADWSEYFGHQPGDGSGDVYFHLDPLWSDSNIDAIGIDNYWPLSDWRDGDTHLDKVAGYEYPHDFAYLKANVFGGEGYDWFYASEADRNSQTRTPITDGSGKPWVFRFKDIRSWWQNQHYNRPGGVEAASPTDWVPESKPFWFTEIGCPAVDKGSNQPNVFIDPLSDESALPYHSNGERDDLIQRRHIQSMITFFDTSNSNYVDGSNPNSSVYSGPMVDVSRIYVYNWDARPFPEFPLYDLIWSDGPKWEKGHWLTGRIPQNSTEPTGRELVARRFTQVPRDPYIMDIKKGRINPLWLSFFESIERRTVGPIDDLSAEPSATEIALTINQIISVLQTQGFIASNDS